LFYTVKQNEIVVKNLWSSREPAYSFGQKLWAFTRLCGSLIRGINPRAERPPVPDWNLANLGGAIVPALGRRWRRRA
jgi:hypothetical protein